MDIDYNSLIDFSALKGVMNERGIKVKWLAEKIEQPATRLSQIIRNNTFPKSDVIAKLCFYLNVRPSQIVSFKIDADEKKKKWFEEKELPYSPAANSTGELTYEPLRIMMTMYLDYYSGITGKDKTVNDLFDMIEPYRRRNGLVNVVQAEWTRKAMIGKGLEADHKSARADRKYKAKGLTPVMRSKLKTDKPLNIRSLYDICNFFGCSIDWVMSYK